MDYTLLFDTEISSRLWDSFLVNQPQAHPEQSSGWVAVEKLNGWKVRRTAVARRRKIVAGAQLALRSVRWLGRVGYVRQGPTVSADEGHATVRSLLVDGIDRLRRELDVSYLVIDSTWPDPDLASALQRNGFRRKHPNIPPMGLSEATLLIDLSPTLEELLRGMRRETRRLVRLTAAEDLEFVEGEFDDLPIFFDLMSVTAVRFGGRPRPGSLAFLQALWKTFHRKGWMRLFFTRHRGEFVNAALIFPFGPTVRFWKYGWSGSHQKLHPNHFLYWQLIKWSKAAGHRFFDIVQVEPRIARLIREHRDIPKSLKQHELYGPTLFKTGFGGEVVRFEGAFCRCAVPLQGLLGTVLDLPVIGRRCLNWVARIDGRA